MATVPGDSCRRESLSLLQGILLVARQRSAETSSDAQGPAKCDIPKLTMSSCPSLALGDPLCGPFHRVLTPRAFDLQQASRSKRSSLAHLGE